VLKRRRTTYCVGGENTVRENTRVLSFSTGEDIMKSKGDASESLMRFLIDKGWRCASRLDIGPGALGDAGPV
jgi:hypothetical protein